MKFRTQHPVCINFANQLGVDMTSCSLKYTTPPPLFPTRGTFQNTKQYSLHKERSTRSLAIKSQSKGSYAP